MPDQVEVSGLAELRQTLLIDLPEALQGKASQAALTKAAAPIVTMAKSLAPSRRPKWFVGPAPQSDRPQGLLRRSIYSYRNRNSTKTYESRFIGVKQKAWYWRFIEFGRASIERDKGSMGTPQHGWFGKKVRAVPAKPFLRPAFEALKLRAIDIYKAALIPAIQKVSQKAVARSARRLRKAITGF